VLAPEDDDAAGRREIVLEGKIGIDDDTGLFTQPFPPEWPGSGAAPEEFPVSGPGSFWTTIEEFGLCQVEGETSGAPQS